MCKKNYFAVIISFFLIPLFTNAADKISSYSINWLPPHEVKFSDEETFRSLNFTALHSTKIICRDLLLLNP
jgi:hypothetical protein